MDRQDSCTGWPLTCGGLSLIALMLGVGSSIANDPSAKPSPAPGAKSTAPQNSPAGQTVPSVAPGSASAPFDVPATISPHKGKITDPREGRSRRVVLSARPQRIKALTRGGGEGAAAPQAPNGAARPEGSGASPQPGPPPADGKGGPAPPAGGAPAQPETRPQ